MNSQTPTLKFSLFINMAWTHVAFHWHGCLSIMFGFIFPKCDSRWWFSAMICNDIFFGVIIVGLKLEFEASNVIYAHFGMTKLLISSYYRCLNAQFSSFWTLMLCSVLCNISCKRKLFRVQTFRIKSYITEIYRIKLPPFSNNLLPLIRVSL